MAADCIPFYVLELMRCSDESYETGHRPDREETMTMRGGEGMATSSVKFLPRTGRKNIRHMAYHTWCIILPGIYVPGIWYYLVQTKALKTLCNVG